MIHERINIRNNSSAYFDTYIIDDPLEQSRKRPIVVVCPGGGYEYCSMREAEPVALAFNAAGFHAVVLYYSVNKMYPSALIDLSDTVCILRDREDRWRIDTNKVIVCGFSAGGHLAASLGTLWNSEEKIIRSDKKNRPNGMILAYPVITAGSHSHAGSISVLTKSDEAIKQKISLEKHVTSDCPPAFIWHTFTDDCVPVENSIYFAEALAKEKISTELHIFPKGSHGLSLANEIVAKNNSGIVSEVQSWLNMAVRWINKL